MENTVTQFMYYIHTYIHTWSWHAGRIRVVSTDLQASGVVEDNKKLRREAHAASR
jgi:hypothetical protein